MSKDLEKIKEQTRINLIAIGGFMHETKGFPLESYIDLIREKFTSLDAQMKFVFHFYEQNKNWCEKNNVIVHYDKICSS